MILELLFYGWIVVMVVYMMCYLRHYFSPRKIVALDESPRGESTRPTAQRQMERWEQMFELAVGAVPLRVAWEKAQQKVVTIQNEPNTGTYLHHNVTDYQKQVQYWEKNENPHFAAMSKEWLEKAKENGLKERQPRLNKAIADEEAARMAYNTAMLLPLNQPLHNYIHRDKDVQFMLDHQAETEKLNA